MTMDWSIYIQESKDTIRHNTALREIERERGDVDTFYIELN